MYEKMNTHLDVCRRLKSRCVMPTDLYIDKIGRVIANLPKTRSNFLTIHLFILLVEILSQSASQPFSTDPQILMSIVRGLYSLRPGTLYIGRKNA